MQISIFYKSLNRKLKNQMEYFESDYFQYRNNKLYCEELSVQEIAEAVGSPAYIYSKKYFIDRYKEFDEAFKNIKHKIFLRCDEKRQAFILPL